MIALQGDTPAPLSATMLGARDEFKPAWQADLDTSLEERLRKFPFAYFYRASCRRLTNDKNWHHDVATARSILIVTTQIPGHHVNHDEILKMIDDGNLGSSQAQ